MSIPSLSPNVGVTRHTRLAAGLLVAMVVALAGCRSLEHSASKTWSPDQAVLPTAEFQESQAMVRNIRNCSYRSEDDYSVQWYDKTFDLNKIRSVDFIVVPFTDFKAIAHTFLSFGFEGDEYVAVSVEVRREKGEEFSALKGLLSGYDLMYVVGDERDLIGLRTNFRREDVYVYRARATPEQARELFVGMLNRANRLASRPEQYNLITNNCTTNVRKHINRLATDRIPYGYQVILPGYSDRLAFDLGLIETDKSFAQTREAARVNEVAYIHRESPDFSAQIRR